MAETKEVVGYEGKYSVTSDGQVWSHILRKFLKPTKSNNGYLQVGLYRPSKKARVHRLIAEAFIRNDKWRKKTDVHHINYDKTDNRVENLCWVTKAQNLRIDWRQGVRKRGENGKYEKKNNN